MSIHEILREAEKMSTADKWQLVRHLLDDLQEGDKLDEKDTTAPGYPLHYFDAIDAIDADDMLERPDQGLFEDREPME